MAINMAASLGLYCHFTAIVTFFSKLMQYIASTHPRTLTHTSCIMKRCSGEHYQDGDKKEVMKKI